MKDKVGKKAEELNYKPNSQPANLRKKSSKTIGVIAPQSIAGIEETCFKNGHSLIICQSHESFRKEFIARPNKKKRQQVEAVTTELND